MLLHLSRRLLRFKRLPSQFTSVAFYKSCPTSGSDSKMCRTAGNHQLGYYPYVPPCPINHDEKNMKLKRPMSPHLEIYGPTVPAMTSIMQRMTGVMLSLLTAGVAASEMLYKGGVCKLIVYIHNLHIPSTIVIATKILLAWLFFYHYFNGLRFVFFNLGKGLGLKTAYQTAYAAIFVSFVLAIAAGLLGHAYEIKDTKW